MRWKGMVMLRAGDFIGALAGHPQRTSQNRLFVRSFASGATFRFLSVFSFFLSLISVLIFRPLLPLAALLSSLPSLFFSGLFWNSVGSFYA